MGEKHFLFITDYQKYVEIIISLVAILVLAKALGEISERLGYPSMIGEIFAGIILGPTILGFVQFDDAISVFADLGIISLLFISGAEMNLRTFSRTRRASTSTAIGGVAIPFIIGFIVGFLFSLNFEQMLFMGIVMSVTSIGIAVRTLIDMKRLNTRAGYTVVGAAILDDIIGIVLLAIVSSFAIKQDGDLIGTFLPLMVGIAFLIVLIVFGRDLVARLYESTRLARTHEMPYAVAIISGLVLALITHLLGLHYAIGAFVAGLIIGPQLQKNVHLLESLSDFAIGFMATFFFGSVGLLFAISADSLLSWFVLAVVIAAIAGKVMGGYIGSRRYMGSGTEALLVGIGLCPRGEMALIIANVAFIGGIIDEVIFTAVTVMVIVTILFTPTTLKRGFRALDRKRGMGSPGLTSSQ